MARTHIRVLIVEDDTDIREILRTSVHKNLPAAQILEAADRPEGLRLAMEHPPKVAIIDINLPGGSGLTLARRIKEHAPGTLVIVCTLNDSPEYRAAAEAFGAVFWAKGQLTSGDFEILREDP